MAADQVPHPASFLQRSAAWSIDAALIAPIAGLLVLPWMEAPARALHGRLRALLEYTGHALGEAMAGGAPSLLDPSALRESIASVHAALWSLACAALLAYALLGAVYHVACERSSWQGSVGKRLLGLRACDMRGQPLDAGRAGLRYLTAALSWATFNIGHLMAALPPAHRALHDRCSATQVLASSVGLPRWAWAWLGVLSLAGIVAVAWVATAAAAILRAALELALYGPA